jgi:phage gp36-like protein
MQVTLPEIGSVSTLTSGHLTNYANQAESIVNGQIVRRYTVPVSPAPPLLETISTDIAIYRTLIRLYNQERMAASPWPDRYKESMETLQMIADGSILLVDSAGNVITGRSDIAEVWSSTKDYTPTFNEGPWSNQIQDEDKVQDAIDEREGSILDRLL